jgi:hypothetical protein
LQGLSSQADFNRDVTSIAITVLFCLKNAYDVNLDREKREKGKKGKREKVKDIKFKFKYYF